MNLGRYRLVCELGRGGMGIVHLAEARDGRLVAIKQLRPDLARDPQHRDMFMEEARIGARLVHPNIARVHEIARDDDRLFMALELLEGCSLGRVRKGLGARLPVRLAVRVLAEVLAALHHAHAQGIVHRDVSPENVSIGFDGSVKLLDFGVAKARDRSQVTREGVVKGSIQYMSPDHVASEPIDGRADVFAVGVLLREILTGEKLWPADLDDMAVVRRLIVGELPPFPANALRRTPKALREICTKAMATDRRRRYATARAMREALEAWLDADDPGGSLSKLGALLRRELPVEHGRVQRLREEGRSAVSLPSSELVTDGSITLELRKRKKPRRNWRGPVATAVVAAIALVGFLAHDEDATTKAPPPRIATTVHAAPAPTVLTHIEPNAAPEPPAIDPYDPGY